MGQGFSATKAKQLGDEKFKQGDFETAICYYSRILQYEKNNHLVMSNRWLWYLKTGQYGYAYEDAVHVRNIYSLTIHNIYFLK